MREQERRRFIRQPVRDTRVILQRRGEAPRPGTIREFSLGGRGLLVHSPSIAGSVSRDEILALGIALPDRNLARRALAKVIRSRDQCIALELVEPEVGLLVALQEAANRARTASNGSAASERETGTPT